MIDLAQPPWPCRYTQWPAVKMVFLPINAPVPKKRLPLCAWIARWQMRLHGNWFVVVICLRSSVPMMTSSCSNCCTTAASSKNASSALSAPPRRGRRLPIERSSCRTRGDSCSESVRRLYEGLQSFLSIKRMEARRRKASALWLRFSQSLARRRHRPSQPMVRSTIQRLGRTTKPLA